MTENEKHLKEAQKKVKEFETKKESERLREAYISLENVYLPQEYDAATRTRLRRDSLMLWLEMIRLLDENIDVEFNSDDVPKTVIQPPPSANGAVYSPGADPSKIDNPTDRAEYEKAIAANRAKAENYRLQTHLRRLNEQIPPRAETFIRDSYIDSADDQKEVKNAIDTIIEKPERKADLMKLVENPR